MDNENGTINCIYICNMYMFFLMACFTLYVNVLLNSVLITLDGTHAVVKAQVKKHYCSSEIYIYIYIYIYIRCIIMVRCSHASDGHQAGMFLSIS